MANGQWRPELAVCTGSSSSPDLVVPGNTFWYATGSSYSSDLVVSGNTLWYATGSSYSSDLVVPGNTLWYAKYRVNVTVSVSDGSNTAALERSAPATTYLPPCSQVKITAKSHHCQSRAQGHTFTG